MNRIEPLVLRVADVAEDGWDDPVHGRVRWRTLFSGDLTPTEKITLGIATLDAGDRLKPHRHDPPEVYMILDGHAVVTIDGVDHAVGPDTAVFIPGNAEHGIRNPGPARVRFLYAFGVDSFADVVYRFTGT
jgi:mannose-6-phosphate isomerase-like protein (cupin superfamily)